MIPSEDLLKIQTKQRIQEPIDSATLVIDSAYGDYAARIDPGDRIEIWKKNVQGAPYGTGPYNVGPYSSAASRRWTGIVRGMTYERDSPVRTKITIDAEDYVFGIMNMRMVYDAYEGAQIAGGEGAIVDSLIADNAPEIGLGGVADVDTTTDMFVDGRPLLDVIMDTARRSNSIIWGDGQTLYFKPATDFSADRSLSTSDISSHALRVTDDHMVNELRVDGGTDYAVDQEQTEVTNHQRVTDKERVMVPITARKSSYDRIEIWTNRDLESEDSLLVRLQNDRNGAPVAVDDTESDIAQQQIPKYFLGQDSYTTFLMPQHVLPPGERIWLIIQAAGETGHEIGVNDDGIPAFRAHFPFPLDIRVEDFPSQQEYRRRQGREKRSNISSFAAARDYGRGILNHATDPRRELAFQPQSDQRPSDPNYLDLDIGDVFVAEFPWETAEGDYIVAERNDTWENSSLDTAYVAREVASI